MKKEKSKVKKGAFTLIVLDGVVAQGRQGLRFRGAHVDESCVERVQAAVRLRGECSRHGAWHLTQLSPKPQLADFC